MAAFHVANGMELMTTIFINFQMLNMYCLFDVEVTFVEDEDPNTLGKIVPLCVSNG